MNTDTDDLAVLITCKHEAILLLKWLKKSRARTVCTSVNAYLLLQAEGFGETSELIDAPLPGGRAVELVAQAEYLARALDADIARYIGEVVGAPVSQGWDYWDKLLFATSLLPVAEWLRMHDLSGLPERVAVCCFASPQDYFHPSAIRTQLYAEALRRAGKRVVKIPIEYPLGPPHTPGVWQTTYRVSLPARHLKGARLVHVPSAFYAQEALVAMYGVEGFLGLDSPFYENHILLRKVDLDRGDVANRPSLIDMAEPLRLYQAFAEALGFANIDGMPQQLAHWRERLAFQFRAFKMLSLLRDRYGVGLAAISDHDGGLFGPLCSAFREQVEPVRVFPHSTISVGPLPDLASEVIGFMEPLRPLRPFDRATLPVPNLQRGIPRPCSADAAIAIVLNEIDDVSGLPVHSLRALLDFLAALVAGLLVKGLRPLLRARPSTPIRAFCDFDIETWDGDLGELISESAVYVGVGQVTTAVCRFWGAGVVCLHVQEGDLSLQDGYTLPADGVECFVGRPFMESLPEVLACIEGHFAEGGV